MTISFLEGLFEKIKETIRENFPGLSGRFVLPKAVCLVFTENEKGSGTVLLSNECKMFFEFRYSTPFFMEGFPCPVGKVFLLDSVSFTPSFSD
jgi:hypothetical protein